MTAKQQVKKIYPDAYCITQDRGKMTFPPFKRYRYLVYLNPGLHEGNYNGISLLSEELAWKEALDFIFQQMETIFEK